MKRICCVCQKEEVSGVVTFAILLEGYPVGPQCHASWRIEAQSLGLDLLKPARVHMAFQRWLETRKVAA